MKTKQSLVPGRPGPYLVCLLCFLCVFVVNLSADDPLRTAGDRPIDIRHIRLDLKVDLPKKAVDARATLQVRSLRPLAAVALDAVDFEVKRVLLGTDAKDGDLARFSQ